MDLNPFSLARLLRFLGNLDAVKPYISVNRYLNYDAEKLIALYSEEAALDVEIPYCEIARWLGVSVQESLDALSRVELSVEPKRFTLSFDGDNNLKKYQVDALEEFYSFGKASSNGELVRLRDVKRNGDSLIFEIEEAGYYDQVQSNLVMDWEEGPPIGATKTLRKYLGREFGRNLPPLSDPRMANTIGIATVLLYQEKDEYVPYLVRRVKSGLGKVFNSDSRVPKSVAVNEGGYNCTASSVLPWMQTESFSELITGAMHNTLKREVGVTPDDLDILLPVSLCREYLRGGKPQIFFIGVTHLTRDELDKRRFTAVERTLNAGAVPEVYRALPDYKSLEELERCANKEGMSFEVKACLHYLPEFVQILTSESE